MFPLHSVLAIKVVMNMHISAQLSGKSNDAILAELFHLRWQVENPHYRLLLKEIMSKEGDLI